MFRVLVPALLVVTALLSANLAQARTDAGDLLWQAEIVSSGGTARGIALAAAGGRVALVGSVEDVAGSIDILVKTYVAKTGVLLWQDRIPTTLREPASIAARVAMDGERLVLAAQGGDLSGPQQFGIRSYVAKTGAVLWQVPGFWGDIALDHSRVVASGIFTDQAGVTQPLAQAFDARTGAVLWTTQSPLPPGSRSTGTLGVVAIKSGRVFVASTARREINGSPIVEPCLVRAYDLKTGSRQWQTLQETSTFCFPAQIASDGDRVVVSGAGGGSGDGFTVLAFDAKTGMFVWSDRRPGAIENNVALAVDTAGRRTFVAGYLDVVGGPTGQQEFIVRAYDTDTGIVLWNDEIIGPGRIDWRAFDLEAESGRVFAAGHQRSIGGPWIVRAYKPQQGLIVWEDQFQPPGEFPTSSFTMALAVDDGRVFVLGPGVSVGANQDILLRAYDAK